MRHELRYTGQSFELPVDAVAQADGSAIEPRELIERFEAAHELRYGYRDEAAAVELVTLRAAVWGPRRRSLPASAPTRPQDGRGPR